MSGNDKDCYLKLLSIANPQEAYQEIKNLASGLSDKEHLIRSCIFDLHAAVEVELRRIFYHYLKRLLFLTDDKYANAATRIKFEQMIERLGFMDMYRILGPILSSWPYPNFGSITEINRTRNKAAHAYALERVTYKNRNPFRDPDCLSQMYFDVWAIKQELPKFFWRTIDRPDMLVRAYYQKYGDIEISSNIIEEVNNWFETMTNVDSDEAQP